MPQDLRRIDADSAERRLPRCSKRHGNQESEDRREVQQIPGMDGE